MWVETHCQEGFVKRAQKLGYQFDGASAKTLQEGFSAIKDADAALCLELLKRKAMQKCVVSGVPWHKLNLQGSILLHRHAGYCKVFTLGFERTPVHPFHGASFLTAELKLTCSLPLAAMYASFPLSRKLAHHAGRRARPPNVGRLFDKP